MANNKLLNYIRNYYKKKSKFSLASDVVFVVLIILLIIPSTRVEVASLFIRLTSFSPSQLDNDEQFNLTSADKTWQLTTLDGKTVSLGELLDGQPVFINFWATWCPPCVAELPGIEDLYEKYGDRVHFVLATTESPATIKAFAEKRQFQQLPFYRYRSVPASFQSETIPATFVIGKSGRVVVSKKGAARWNSDRMNQILDQLLAEESHITP